MSCFAHRSTTACVASIDPIPDIFTRDAPHVRPSTIIAAPSALFSPRIISFPPARLHRRAYTM